MRFAFSVNGLFVFQKNFNGLDKFLVDGMKESIFGFNLEISNKKGFISLIAFQEASSSSSRA